VKTWREAYRETWLGNPDQVADLDRWVRRVLSAHRMGGIQAMQSVAPWSVETLARDIGAFGDKEQWLWCVTAISILQELVFCAEAGGMRPTGVATDADLERDIEALRAIRNTVLHPAFQRAGDDLPPMVRLIALLEADDDPEVTELALRLPDDWAYLAQRPAATYAIRKLGSAGQLFLEKMAKRIRIVDPLLR
jgi:hypothetical protein